MIVVDVSESKDVIKAFNKKLGKDNYRVEQIGTLDCNNKLFPIKKDCCVNIDEMIILTESKVNYDKSLCNGCDNRNYIRFADFTNDTYSFYYERKTVLDFIGSRKRRLYEQLNKIDTFVEGRKGLILEGMSNYTSIYDNYWENIDRVALQKLSPLEQIVHLGGRREWTLSFIRELKSRDMEFVQTWNINETIDFLIQCDEGYDKTPKLRILPKRYPQISIERNILVLFDGIGKVRSEKILKNDKIKKNLEDLINNVKELGYG